jgi:hypothetical protein
VTPALSSIRGSSPGTPFAPGRPPLLVTVEDVSVGKPDPEGYLGELAELLCGAVMPGSRPAPGPARIPSA